MVLKKHGKAIHLLPSMNSLVSKTLHLKTNLSQIQNLVAVHFTVFFCSLYNVTGSDHNFGGWLLPSLDQTRRTDQSQTGSSRPAPGAKKVVRINIE